KDKSISNLLRAIDAARHRGIDRLLVGLGIRHVGVTAARKLADAIPSIYAIAAASVDDVAAVDGVGPVIAQAIHDFFKLKKTREILEKLRRGGVTLAEEREAVVGPLSGKTFVITGTLDSLSREAAGARIEALGGKVTSSISKKTDYLVVGDSPGTKLEK